MINKIAIEFMTFIKVNSSVDSAYVDNPPMHYELADKLLSKDLFVLVEVFRGGAKTTLVEWLMVFIAFKGGALPFTYRKRVRNIKWFSSTERNLKGSLYSIADKIMKSEVLRPLIDNKLFYISKLTNEILDITVPKYKDNLGNPYVFHIDGSSFSSRVRGSKVGDDRPQLIVVDDVLTTDMMRSEAKLLQAKETWAKDVYPMQDDNAKFIYIGTPVSPKDIIADLEKNPMWKVHKYPICEKFPCSREEFKGYWEAKFPYDKVTQIYELMADDKSAFYQEYMLQPISQSSKLVPEGALQEISADLIRSNLENYNIYIAVDFAVSEKDSADYTAMGVFAVDYRGAWILIDGIHKKQEFTMSINDLFMLVKKYTLGMRVPTVLVEKTGQQLGLISVLRDEQYKRNTMFLFGSNKGTHSKTKEYNINNYGIDLKGISKTERFIVHALPQIHNGLVFLGIGHAGDYSYNELISNMKEQAYTVNQDQGLNGLKHDDCLDLLTLMGLADILTPNVISEEQQKLIQNIKKIKEHYLKEYGHILSDYEAKEIIENQKQQRERIWGKSRRFGRSSR